eukprot:SAG31_NODE_836_length_11643_cov_3.389813_8_plen_277_part_00
MQRTNREIINHVGSWNQEVKPLSLAHSLNAAAFSSAAAAVIAATDFLRFLSQPFCGEVPVGILQFVEANPTSVLAQRYRLYIRHALLPPIMRVVELLEAHGAVTELPPIEWLAKRFPGELWHIQPPRTFRRFWYARARAWQAVVAEWNDGGHGKATPGGEFLPFGVPWASAAASANCFRHNCYQHFSTTFLFCSVLFCSVLFCSVLFCSVLFCSVLFCSVLFLTGGMVGINDWAIARNEDLQRELIGMTAKADLPQTAYEDAVSIYESQKSVEQHL